METEQLANLIGRKRQLLESLWQLTERQAVLVAESDLTRLLTLLAAKQTLLNQLQTVERGARPVSRTRSRSTPLAFACTRAAARRDAEVCEQLLAEVMRVERECESKLAHRRDDAAHRLQGAHDASQARAAYLQASMAGSHQIDLSSET